MSSAISDRVIPKIRNIVNLMSSSGNRDSEASSSANSQDNRERTTGFKTKIAMNDSRSACDLKDTEDHSPYKKQQQSVTFLLSDHYLTTWLQIWCHSLSCEDVIRKGTVLKNSTA